MNWNRILLLWVMVAGFSGVATPAGAITQQTTHARYEEQVSAQSGKHRLWKKVKGSGLKKGLFRKWLKRWFRADYDEKTGKMAAIWSLIIGIGVPLLLQLPGFGWGLFIFSLLAAIGAFVLALVALELADDWDKGARWIRIVAVVGICLSSLELLFYGGLLALLLLGVG